MKQCAAILALASGAFAAQDVTPPVITLSLANMATIQPSNGVVDHHTDAHDPHPSHAWMGKDADGKHKGRDPFSRSSNPTSEGVAKHAPQVDNKVASKGISSATCEVDSTVAECPLPTCTAHDHHDGKLDCTMYTEAININNQAIPTSKAKSIPFTRNLRAEFLLKYDAVDDVGNKAETVSFTMIFHDVTPPVLTTEFGVTSNAATSAKTVTKADRSEAQSCNMETTNPKVSKAPCTWKLKQDQTAEDDYDGDVTKTITRKLTYGGAEIYDYSIAQAKAQVAHAGLIAGGAGYGFSGSYSTKGLYCYSSGTYKGRCYFGTGGTMAQMKAAVSSPKYRVPSFMVDTRKLGDWKVTVGAHDRAGIFGKGEKDNTIEQVATIKVVDTKPPVITSDDWDLSKGYNDHKSTLECGVDTYVEPHANCWDRRDQWSTAANKYVVKRAAEASTTKGNSAYPKNTLTIDAAASETTKYTVTYSCKDESLNRAKNTVRTLTVQDTTDPVVKLVGSSVIENSAGDDNSHAAHDADFEDKKLNIAKLRNGASCTDECDTHPTIVASLHYGGDCTGDLVPGAKKDGDNLANFPEYTAGDYSVKYVCSDGNAGDVRVAHTSQVCRKIQNVDHTLPTITILGSNTMTLEATHTGNYVDDGAVCSDQVDGVISQNVEVSGDVVNLSKAGAYDITYNCKDSAGNSAPTVHRSVTVKQTTCPTCRLNDPTKGTIAGKPLRHEASFPYTDAGAVCSDLIDGIVKTVPTNPVNVEKTGEYVVTYRAKNSVPLWNDDASCRGTATTYFRTIKVEDTLKPIIRLKYKNVEVARSAVLDTGIPDSKTGVAAANPAAAGLSLMAEQQTGSASAWVLAAAASAVTGLALLGYSSSRTAPTSVPV